MSNSADDTPNSDTSTEGDDEVLDLTEEIPGDADEAIDDSAETIVENAVEPGDVPEDDAELRETIQTSREELQRVEHGETSEEVPSAALVTPREPVGPEPVGGETEEHGEGGGGMEKAETVEAEPLDPPDLDDDPLNRRDDDASESGGDEAVGEEEPIELDPLDSGELEREARSSSLRESSEIEAPEADRSDASGEAVAETRPVDEVTESDEVGESAESVEIGEDLEAEEIDEVTEVEAVDEDLEAEESDEVVEPEEVGEDDEPERREEGVGDVETVQTEPVESEDLDGEQDEEEAEEVVAEVGERSEEGGGEAYQTVKMEAVDRTALEREGQLRQLEQTLPLLSSRFSPRILVSPPGQLVEIWRSTSELGLSEPSEPPEATPSREEAIQSPPETIPDQQPTPDAPEPTQGDPATSAGREPPEELPTDREGSSGPSGAQSDAGTTKPPATPAEGSNAASPDAQRSRTPPSAPAQADDVPAHKRETAPGIAEREGEEREAEQQSAPTAREKAPTPPPQREDDERDEELSEIVEELVEGEEAAEEEEGRRGDWVQNVFGELFLATVPDSIERRTVKEADFIEASLDLTKEDKILDLACGYGRHTLELAGRGYDVIGFDLSKPLLKKALTAAQRKSLEVNFFHGDMRSLEFENVFDQVFCWQSSFGYFEDRVNLDILARINRSLKPGGTLLLDIMNRDYVVRKLPHRIWWEGRDCIFLEEGEFDFDESVLHMNRSFIYESGRPPIEQDWWIRLYSRHEIIQALERAGFQVTEISGAIHYRGYFIGRDSPQLIVRADKKRSLGE